MACLSGAAPHYSKRGGGEGRQSASGQSCASVKLEDALAGKAVIPVFWVPGNKLPVLVAAPVHFLGRREVRSTLEGVLEKAPVDTEGEAVDE